MRSLLMEAIEVEVAADNDDGDDGSAPTPASALLRASAGLVTAII